MLAVANRRTHLKTLQRQYGDAVVVLDVTSRGPQPWLRFSPFYPHGSIPVPFSPAIFSESVEGIWQGLKVFEKQDIDPSRFRVADMKGLKRSVRRFGRILGHRKGVDGEQLLTYRQARELIYLPSYRWVLENRLSGLVGELRQLSGEVPVVLLDYQTNGDLDDLSRPLSHAVLVKRYVEWDWPA
jgi:hypothetical protein